MHKWDLLKVYKAGSTLEYGFSVTHHINRLKKKSLMISQ